MSDEQMDTRLQSAGERWRSGTAVAEPVDGEPIELIAPTPSTSHRTLAMVSAATVVVALVVGGVLFAVNRGSTSSPAGGGDPTRALQGVTWRDVRSESTLVFLPGGARLTGNCYAKTRTLQAHGHRLVLGRTVGPGWLCGGVLQTPTAQRAERRFERVVEHGSFVWALAGRVLTLSAGGTTISLNAAIKRPVDLVGQTWVLDTVNEPSGHTDRKGYGATLKINRDGTFVANDSCNTLNGSVQTSLASLAFTDVSASANRCTEPAPVRPVIDTLLNGTTGFLINGDQLILRRNGYRGGLYYSARHS